VQGLPLIGARDPSLAAAAEMGGRGCQAFAMLPIVMLLAAFAAPAGEIRGAAVSGSTLYTWGAELTSWRLPSLDRRVILQGRDFASGGCAVQGGLVLQEHGRAILVDPSSGRELVFETETRFASCLQFSIAGRKGILLSHLDVQLRFYLLPGFEVKELYSIYTASRQGGLLAQDIDRDGFADLFFGNYWVKNPGSLDVAWRLYAINLWHDTEVAALASMAVDGEDLIWAESQAPKARIARFRKPANPADLWLEERLPPLDQPGAVLVTREGILVGHAAGVELFLQSGGRRRLAESGPCLALADFEGVVYAVWPFGVRPVYPRR
jgi:hypothetical protein